MPPFIFVPEWDSKTINAICRWHIAATSANTGGYIYFCPRGRNANESLPAYRQAQLGKVVENATKSLCVSGRYPLRRSAFVSHRLLHILRLPAGISPLHLEKRLI